MARLLLTDGMGGVVLRPIPPACRGAAGRDVDRRDPRLAEESDAYP